MSRTLLLLALFAALLAVPAAAQDAAPQPGCQGMQVTDKAGDSANTQTGDAGSPSTDIVGGFITMDGAGKVTANVMVDTLTAGEIDPPYVANSWEFAFNVDGKAPRYVRGYQDRSGTIKWTWGEPRAVTDDQTAPRAGGTTEGRLFEGKNGVVQIDIPLADMEIKPGAQLKGLAIETRQWAGTPAATPNTGLPVYSYAPPYDDAAGKGAFTVGSCPATPPPTVAPGTPSDVTTPGPTAAPALDVKVTVPKLKASKLRKGRKIAFKLSGKASAITAALRVKTAEGKAIATGKLAKLDGKGKLALKLKRKPKKGKYVLTLAGKNADGRSAAGAIGVRIR